METFAEYKKEQKDKHTTIYFTSQEYHRLQWLAEKKELTKSDVLRALLNGYFQSHQEEGIE